MEPPPSQPDGSTSCPANETWTWQVAAQDVGKDKRNDAWRSVCVCGDGRGRTDGDGRGDWTHSAVICVTRGSEVKPEPRKESRYWVIFSAASQSSTELTLLRSGAPRSNKG